MDGWPPICVSLACHPAKQLADGQSHARCRTAASRLSTNVRAGAECGSTWARVTRLNAVCNPRVCYRHDPWTQARAARSAPRGTRAWACICGSRQHGQLASDRYRMRQQPNHSHCAHRRNWPDAQYFALVRCSAAINRRPAQPSARAIGTRSPWVAPPSKWDPGAIDMDILRRDIQDQIGRVPSPVRHRRDWRPSRRYTQRIDSRRRARPHL